MVSFNPTPPPQSQPWLCCEDDDDNDDEEELLETNGPEGGALCPVSAFISADCVYFGYAPILKAHS